MENECLACKPEVGKLIATTGGGFCVECGRFVRGDRVVVTAGGGPEVRRTINRPHYKDLLERCEREKEWLMKRVEELRLIRKRWWRFWK